MLFTFYQTNGPDSISHWLIGQYSETNSIFFRIFRCDLHLFGTSKLGGIQLDMRREMTRLKA